MSSFAQFEEHFTDGGFNVNPDWNGTESLFLVDINTRQLFLRGNNTGGSAYLSTSDNSAGAHEWKFYLRLGFNPTDNDYVKVYLTASQPNLLTPLDGYFLKIGRNGASDGLEFYRQDGTNEVVLLKMLPGLLDNFPSLNIQVYKDNSNKWVFLWKENNATTYSRIDSIVENTHSNGTHFGFACTYTNATKDSFAFDDLYSIILPNAPTDIVPPKIDSIQVINNREIAIFYNEEMDTNTIKTVANYFINGFGNPVSAVIDVLNPRVVYLRFASPFLSNTNYILTASNVTDIAGNKIVTNNNNFRTYYFAQLSDIVITEIMTNPMPLHGLPNAQYIELKNRTSEKILLNKWKVKGKTIKNGFISANNTVVVCASTDTTALKSFGNTIGIDDWSTLNTADAIEVFSESDILIDSITFNKSWYKDAIKENGGYSLELYENNVSGDCAKELLWSASQATIGGTPNSANRFITTFNTHARAILVNPSTIDIDFEGNMDKTEVSKIANYTLTNGASVQSVQILDVEIKKIRLQLNTSLQPNVIYHLFINNMIGCVGAIQQKDTFEFAITDIPVEGDLIINEILYRTNTGGEQFVELYNKTSKLFKLKDIIVAQADVISGNELQIMNLADTKGYIFPNTYIVFSKNKNTVMAQYSNTVIENCVDVNLPTFDNTEDIIVLKNARNEIIDKLHYNDNWHYALLETTNGVSLEKSGPDFPTQVQRYWHSAAKEVGFATPGFLNSEDNYKLEDGVHVVPEIFSPDGDGVDDETKITYSFNEDGNVVNVYLYNSEGQLINKLIENLTIQKSGAFVWDGLTSKGYKTAIGIHFLVFERTTPQGKKVTYRLRCGVAAKLN